MSRFYAGLFISLQKKFRQRFERHGAAAENFQRPKSFAGQLGGNPARFFQPHNRGIGRLLHGHILARRFPELLAGLGHIQNVIDHLEGQADMITKFSQRRELGVGSPGTELEFAL